MSIQQTRANIVFQLIKDKRWDQPIERTTVTDLNEMYDAIKHMIIMIGTESSKIVNKA